MNVRIEVIDHKDQRYETCGDWFHDEKGDLVIRVDRLSNWRLSMLVAVHELIEALVCKSDRIRENEVTEFDKKFEEERKLGLHGEDDEPGDASDAPYRQAHSLAMAIERILSVALRVDWKKYENEIP